MAWINDVIHLYYWFPARYKNMKSGFSMWLIFAWYIWTHIYMLSLVLLDRSVRPVTAEQSYQQNYEFMIRSFKWYLVNIYSSILRQFANMSLSSSLNSISTRPQRKKHQLLLELFLGTLWRLYIITGLENIHLKN